MSQFCVLFARSGLCIGMLAESINGMWLMRFGIDLYIARISYFTTQLALVIFFYRCVQCIQNWSEQIFPGETIFFSLTSKMLFWIVVVLSLYVVEGIATLYIIMSVLSLPNGTVHTSHTTTRKRKKFGRTNSSNTPEFIFARNTAQHIKTEQITTTSKSTIHQHVHPTLTVENHYLSACVFATANSFF